MMIWFIFVNGLFSSVDLDFGGLKVPNLFNKDDLTMIFDTIRPIAKKAGAGETDDDLFTYFIEKVRESLHVVLCLSPVSQQFQKRLQMFPGLVNCTTIDW